MCGITGFLTSRPAAGHPAALSRMMDAIRHRGPDEHGQHIEPPVYLGHLRLSIVDLRTGQQPMTNEDGRLWLVYNGEVFNHAQLRPALETAGHRYRSKSDTETILHGYEEYGPGIVDRLRGMFAFALWDRQERTLFCARDRLGIKPFYYYWDGEQFVFASEIKALLQYPGISAQPDEHALAEYLSFGYVSSEQTMFRGIRKLMPGHWLRLDCRGERPALEIQQYWDIPRGTEPAPRRSDADWIAECRERLEETVRMRLMADVPLGLFLSGGVDSSAIGALMKRMTSGPVKSFAVGYDEAAYSELGYAQQAAKLLGTEHHEVRVNRQDFFDALPGLVWHEDEPISWPSSVSLYFVARLAREHVTVVLTGEGSDELFGGYSRYRHYQWNSRWLNRYQLVPAVLRRSLRDWVAGTQLLSGEMRRKLQHTFIGRGETLQSLYLDNFYGAFSSSELDGLVRQKGPVYDNFLRYAGGSAQRTLSDLLYADQKTYLVELLMKQDQMSMACSLESRVPFLDHPYVEFASRVPDHLKIRDTEGKYILKRAVDDLLPRALLDQKKRGFPTPLPQWIRDSRDLASRLSGSEFLNSYLQPEAIRGLFDRHQRGLEDGTDRIWRLLNLQIWGGIFFEGQPPEAWIAERRGVPVGQAS